MKPTLKSISLILVLLLALTASGCSALTGAPATGTAALQASGVIEASQTSISAELGGRVAEVLVKEGDAVKNGDVLLRLDDSLLQAQRQAASAAVDAANAGLRTAQVGLDAAQAQYDLTLNTALADEQSTRLDSWKQTKPAAFDQPTWFFSKAERLQATQAALDAAQKALSDAQANLDGAEKKAGSALFMDAETRLSQARIAYQVAQTVLDSTNGASDGQDLHDAAQTTLDQARLDLDNALRDYNDALTTAGAQDVLENRARVSVAQENVAAMRDALRALQTGADAPEVAAASRSVDQARAAQQQAQSAVDQAQANLKLIDAQIALMTVRSPLDGVVLTRSIQPGEVLQPGMTALTIGRLDDLKVTVYIPENQYGQIKVGDAAELRVDSYPGQVFKASVTRIADQAEYTPQNVQTTQERQTTVYAVQLSVANPDGRLKPGMPADVTFPGAAPSGS
jgi:HlyD family secretion protein